MLNSPLDFGIQFTNRIHSTSSIRVFFKSFRVQNPYFPKNLQPKNPYKNPYFSTLQGSKPLFFPSESNTITFSSSGIIVNFTSARPGVATPFLAQEWVTSPGQITTIDKYCKSKNVFMKFFCFEVGQKFQGQPFYSTLTLSTFRVPNPYFPKKFRVHPYRGDSYGGG